MPGQNESRRPFLVEGLESGSDILVKRSGNGAIVEKYIPYSPPDAQGNINIYTGNPNGRFYYKTSGKAELLEVRENSDMFNWGMGGV